MSNQWSSTVVGATVLLLKSVQLKIMTRKLSTCVILVFNNTLTVTSLRHLLGFIINTHNIVRVSCLWRDVFSHTVLESRNTNCRSEETFTPVIYTTLQGKLAFLWLLTWCNILKAKVQIDRSAQQRWTLWHCVRLCRLDLKCLSFRLSSHSKYVFNSLEVRNWWI